MRIHHLDCVTVCPRGRRWLMGEGGRLEPARMCGHVLLIEAGEELVLVDTGFGAADVADPRRLGRIFNGLMRPELDPARTAVGRIEALGLDPGDVRHVVATHLDIDHAGGLSDFPEAEVHLFRAEKEAMESPPWRQRSRYVAAHFAHGPRWHPHAAGGDEWLGFESVRPIAGAEVLMIPLHGHSAGHSAVAVRSGEEWLLHAGDAYFHRDEIAAPPGPPGIRAFQAIVADDNRTRRRNQERLRELARRHSGEVRIFCAHDPVELERMRGAGG